MHSIPQGREGGKVTLMFAGKIEGGYGLGVATLEIENDDRSRELTMILTTEQSEKKSE